MESRPFQPGFLPVPVFGLLALRSQITKAALPAVVVHRWWFGITPIVTLRAPLKDVNTFDANDTAELTAAHQ